MSMRAPQRLTGSIHIYHNLGKCIQVSISPNVVFMIISPVHDGVFVSSQTKVDNACLVGVGYTQTLRPG